MGVQYGSQSPDRPVGTASSAQQRRAVYEGIEQATAKAGLHIENAATQGSTAADLFQIVDGVIQPRLQRLDEPVRAIVAPLANTTTANALHAAFLRRLGTIMGSRGIWEQDQALYHSTVWHASPHQHPVFASAAEQDAERSAVQAAAARLCPLHLVLERIVISQAGVVMACWQLLRGSEPETLRRALQEALPRAPPPEQQTVKSASIWYTTLGRLLATPEHAHRTFGRSFLGRSAVEDAVRRLSAELCGTRALVDTLWYLLEVDKMALALNGTWVKWDAPLSSAGCS